ncbi:lipopolysaccharide biosynthesis protein [Micromonospora sp. URMC 103]|uniref:lipopolysaccharide biosynthesis protein n=1 Tax=Micromonospora sp. URMC 103 TaxID=3423406 RepID=UPI003F1AF30E
MTATGSGAGRPAVAVSDEGSPAATPQAPGPDPAAPPPGPTAAARRNRALASGILSSLVGKGVAMAAPLVITPATFRYLGEQRFGLWTAVTALTGMAWFADLGLGNGLLTRLSRNGDDRARAARDITSAYATLGLVAAVLLAALVLLVPLVPWATVFGVDDPGLARDAPWVVLLCFASFAVNVPLSLIQRIQYAQRQVVQSNIWQAVGAAVSTAAVLGAIAAGRSYLLVIACAVLTVPLMNLLNTLVYFGRQDRASRPRAALVERGAAAGLLRLGLQFFALSIMSSIALNLDNPLVAHVLGVAAAAQYAVVAKLFGVLGVFITLVGMALWPANGEALARGEVEWVRRTTARMVVLYGAAVGAAGLALVVWGQPLLRLWVGGVDESLVSVALLAWFAGWSVLLALASPLFLVQNSIGMLRTQFAGWSAFLVASTALKVWWARRFGLVGLPAAGCVAYLLTLMPAAVVGYRRSIGLSGRRQPRHRRGGDATPAEARTGRLSRSKA